MVQTADSPVCTHYFVYDMPSDDLPWRICVNCGFHQEITLTGWADVPEKSKCRASPMRLLALARIGKSNAEIAEEEDLPVRNVQQQLRRARQHLIGRGFSDSLTYN